MQVRLAEVIQYVLILAVGSLVGVGISMWESRVAEETLVMTSHIKTIYSAPSAWALDVWGRRVPLLRSLLPAPFRTVEEACGELPPVHHTLPLYSVYLYNKYDTCVMDYLQDEERRRWTIKHI